MTATSAERKRSQVCSEFEYQKAFERIRYLPSDVKHLVVQLGAVFNEITASLLFHIDPQASLLRIREWFSWKLH